MRILVITQGLLSKFQIFLSKKHIWHQLQLPLLVRYIAFSLCSPLQTKQSARESAIYENTVRNKIHAKQTKNQIVGYQIRDLVN